ncbi:choline dehydrogenase-like flavoprotein [Arthrobacter sp. B3I9]|uniref:FAD-dependent oxidoreductase n=1 Tax=Arthrobacter sp. B3I9 TaxID=3042270 RepID=UPI00278F14FC|nr:FAD-dependent oxidoreductase [Arthrobacter sp. B3I9]MDQ0848571.1 choline dehydrogenase-like flavoprotein [Arthrobacter sp. B3I9]
MFDVCVVGGGTMGLFLAAEQSARGKSVILLEAGRSPGENKDQLLGSRPVRGSHRGSEQAWTTGLGGTSQLWGGQLWPWQDWEFAGLPQKGISAWPLDFGDVSPYYERVLRALGLPATHAQIHGRFGFASKLPTVPVGDYSLKYSSWIDRSRRNFGKNAAIRAQLRNVTVRQGAVVNRINETGSGTAHIELRDDSGALSTVSAKKVVLAAGTLGNARILRNSEVSQDLPALGRGFLDHVSKRIARVDVLDWNKFRAFSAPKSVRGVLASPRIVPGVTLLNAHQLLPCYAHWEFASPSSGAVASLRALLRAGQTGEPRPPLSTTLANMWGESGELIEAVARSVRYRERPVPTSSKPYLRLDVQQPTRHDVQLTWSGNNAEPDFPNLSLAWRTGREEDATAHAITHRLVDFLNSLDIGAAVHELPPGDTFEDIFHMMGGTRMSGTPAEGVVDPDCKVFGTASVFVAGASVFPSGGMANPTFTALALTARIGDKIAD